MKKVFNIVMLVLLAAMIALTIISSPAAYLLAGIQLLPNDAWIAILLFGLVAEGALDAGNIADRGRPHVLLLKTASQHVVPEGLVAVLGAYGREHREFAELGELSTEPL